MDGTRGGEGTFRLTIASSRLREADLWRGSGKSIVIVEIF